MNATIASQSGGVEGIGFTIPSNMASFVSKALIPHGKVERGWLGVSIQDLTPELAKAAHVESLKGALIAEVVKCGPAEKADLKKDDMVIGYHGKEIPASSIFRNEVAATPIGSEVRINILRKGRKQEVTVKIAFLAEADKFLVANIKERLGAEVRSLTPQEGEKYGLKPDAGVAIRWLEFKSPLQKAGFEINDPISDVNEQPVTGVDNFIQMVCALKPHQKIILVALDHRTGNRDVIQVETK